MKDQSPEGRDQLREVLDGLRGVPKIIHPKFLYDERGSQLFDRITETDDYYPTRTEAGILDEHGDEMGELIGPRPLVIEPGAGSVTKIRLLLDHLQDPAAFVPIDISLEHLRKNAEILQQDHPGLEILPLAADYTDDYEIPEPRCKYSRRVVFFPGSTIGNFPMAEARAFLRHLAELAGSGGGLLIGVDLVKDPEVLERAYDDSDGVTAEFNKNLLVRFNRELETDFELENFRHLAEWNGKEDRIEIYLVSERRQSVRLDGEVLDFAAGERVLTEYSQKFTRESFAEMAAEVGFEVVEVWSDSRDYFSVQYLRVV